MIVCKIFENKSFMEQSMLIFSVCYLNCFFRLDTIIIFYFINLILSPANIVLPGFKVP